MVKGPNLPENNLFTLKENSKLINNGLVSRELVRNKKELNLKRDLFVVSNSDKTLRKLLYSNTVDNDCVRVSSLLNPIRIQSDFERSVTESKIGVLVIGKNETNTIKDVLSDIVKVERDFSGGFIKVFIDDGSTDDTLAKAMDFDFTIFQHSESLGIGGAIKSGYYFFKKYRPEIIVQIDSDGEHPANGIPLLVNAIRNNNLDIAIGSRYYNGNLPSTSILKILGVKILSGFFRLISFHNRITDVVSGFRAFRSTCINDLFFISERNWAIEFALRAIKNRKRIGEIPVKYSFRKYGHSQFKSPRSYLKYGINIIHQMINSINDNSDPLLKILK